MHKQKIASNSQIALHHPGVTPSQCASISPCELQFKRAQSALKVWVQVARAPTELTRAIFCSDILSLCLALTIRIGWCPHWQRKEGRQEGRKDDLRVQKFSYLREPLLIPLSARASCFTQHTCDSNPCTFRSRVMTEESLLQWLFVPAYF